MDRFQKLVEEGEKAKDWKKGIVVEHKDKYYWLDKEKKEVVMKGNFL